jgi:hypothetical protein
MASLYLDVFPARITTPLQTYNKAKLLVIDDQAFIYTESKGQITLEKRSTVSEWKASQSRFMPALAITEDGTWEALKMGGCGCGSRLKNFDWHQAMVSA